jgi:hypothetical protein
VTGGGRRGRQRLLDPNQDLAPTKDKLFATPVGGLVVTLSPLA